MELTKSAAIESKKRKRLVDIDDLKKLFDTEPDNYKTAWNQVKRCVLGFNEPTR